ncbi:MAG: ABC transporter substrate-binding protein [Pseudomonadota bacterium]
MTRKAVLLGGAALITAMLPAAMAGAQTADVIHWWTSGGESRAIGVFADAFEDAGGTWVDSAMVGGQAARASAMTRIAGGEPPTAMQWNIGVAVQQLAEEGLLRPLNDLAEAGGWTDNLPPLIVENATHDGNFYAVPVNIHADNWMWYSTAIFDEIGAEPPATWDDFFAVADQIQAAGYTPLALGGQPWQESLMFRTIIIAEGGRDFYRSVFVDHDAEAAGGPEMVQAFEVFGQLREYVDEGSPGRLWNEATMMVANNEAAIQIMGDWAKGEFNAAGLVAGEDYGCHMAPGTRDAYVLVVDVFAFPVLDDEDATAAQTMLAEIMMDPATQVEFNRHKGALPARLDADAGAIDACAAIGEQIVNDADAQLPNMALAFSNDVEGQITDLVTEYWNDPGMSAEEAAERFSDIVANADS